MLTVVVLRATRLPGVLGMNGEGWVAQCIDETVLHNICGGSR